jgi:hypothetical protein
VPLQPEPLEEQPAHVLADIEQNADLLELVQRFAHGKSAWSRAAMMRAGWTRNRWDAATAELIQMGILAGDKSGPLVQPDAILRGMLEQ